jgi:hypothetical protein
MGLWAVVVMPDDVLPPLPHSLILLVQPATVQQRKDTNIKKERYKHQDEMIQNLMQSQQHILRILHVRILYMLNLIIND